jgi:hypothetical protein
VNVVEEPRGRNQREPRGGTPWCGTSVNFVKNPVGRTSVNFVKNPVGRTSVNFVKNPVTRTS